MLQEYTVNILRERMTLLRVIPTKSHYLQQTRA